MKHEIDDTAGYTAGGNKYCTCGTMLMPGGMVTHLQTVIGDLREENDLLIRHAQAVAKSQTFGGIQFVGMIVCEKCGNKRCPRAGNDKFKCTQSNEPGQVGELE